MFLLGGGEREKKAPPPTIVHFLSLLFHQFLPPPPPQQTPLKKVPAERDETNLLRKRSLFSHLRRWPRFQGEGFDKGIGQRKEMLNSDIEIGKTPPSKDETGADGENRVWMIAFLQRRRRRRGCHLLRDERIVRCCCFGSLVISCRKRKMQGGCQICLNRPPSISQT